LIFRGDVATWRSFVLEGPIMGLFVIAAYRPKPGKERELLDIVRDHMPVLRAQNLITDRPMYVMRAKDGTILEVFEWKSKEAIDAAHHNPAVAALWERFHQCCDYTPLKNIAESGEMFANFEPVEI
jgi:quinol monooxygenase YgiN